MEMGHINISEIDIIVDHFIDEYSSGIENLHRIHFKNNEGLSLRAHVAELKEELITGAITLINNEQPIEELNPYLFYIVNAFFKKASYKELTVSAAKTATDYICPGCSYLGKTTCSYISITFFDVILVHTN